ncbi:O-antigen ligase family protein [Elioraea rosea]|uniref:O-antigen ligase family protein n=1 Tax=Elioraea rosea TaxID=2492390 RepID=UPI001185FCAC|nr:O-antigen ligase family protein [Elioraea rosea]
MTGVAPDETLRRSEVAEPAAFGTRAIIVTGILGAMGLLAYAWLMPTSFVRLFPALLLIPIGIACYVQPSLAVFGTIAINPLGPTALLPIAANQAIALTKLAGIGAAAMSGLRHGLSRQFNGPLVGFLVAGALAAAFGSTLPQVTFGETIRSLIGSIAPFAFISARYDRKFDRAFLLTVLAGPLASVVASIALMAIGIGNGPIGGGRLDGMLHPANLAGLSSVAIAAATLELVRGDTRMILWLGINAIILVGSGARVPLLLMTLFGLGVLLLARTTHFRFGHKLRLAGMAVPIVLVGAAIFGPQIIDRSFTTATGQAGFQFSGRDVIWDLFIDVIALSPWFGYGIGAGRFAVDMEQVALLGTNAAHNEYLRLAVDVGVVGVVLIFLGFVVWIARETRRMPPGEATVVRGAALVLAVHSITDNTLIALTMMVRVFWFALVFDRARTEADTARRFTRPRRAGGMGARPSASR